MLGQEAGGCGKFVMFAVVVALVMSTCVAIIGENNSSSAAGELAEDIHAKKVQAMCGGNTNSLIANLTAPKGNTIMKIDAENSVVQVGRGWYLTGIDDKKNLAKVLSVCYSKNEAFSFIDWRTGKQVAKYNALFHLTITE